MEPLSTQTESQTAIADPCSSQAPGTGLVVETNGETKKDPNGHEGSQSTLLVRSDAELENLTEVQLKAAIKSAWKNHEPRVRKDMKPLLYWLRLRLRAQGSRNDIHDKNGFGAWVEKNAGISRATADRWADQYARENGLKEPPPTSPHVSKSDDDDFYRQELDKHSETIQFTHRVTQAVHLQYQEAREIIKTYLKISNDGEAVVKGVIYAAKIIAEEYEAANRNVHAPAKGGASVGDVSNTNGDGGHRGKGGASDEGAKAG